MTGITLRDLKVSIQAKDILKRIDFSLSGNTGIGIVGESGSGKTMLVRSLIGLLPAGARVSGDYELSGRNFKLNAKERLWRSVRGTEIGMVMQDPFTALDPMSKCGKQIALGVTKEGKHRFDIDDALAEVGLSPDVADKYPHELSGGMRQRVVIAATLAGRPKILIADEATTALDVITQKEILDLIDMIRSKRPMPFILISHDIRLVREKAEYIIVMEGGRIVESGLTEQLIASPKEEYTKKLIAADRFLNPANETGQETEGDGLRVISSSLSPLLRVEHLHKSFGSSVALEDVSIDVYPGELVGVVGQSGSGKTTLARCIVGLEKADEGSVSYSGKAMPQIVFQDPYSSLNPAHSVRYTLEEALKVSGRPAADIEELIYLAEIDEELLGRKPAALSGGQRQRVAIARALAPDPELLICDESVSALDVLTQNQILSTIDRLRRERSLTILFITHDLSVVHMLADRVYVMNRARVVESGYTAEVFKDAKDPYTKSLIEASEYGL